MVTYLVYAPISFFFDNVATISLKWLSIYSIKFLILNLKKSETFSLSLCRYDVEKGSKYTPFGCGNGGSNSFVGK